MFKQFFQACQTFRSVLVTKSPFLSTLAAALLESKSGPSMLPATRYFSAFILFPPNLLILTSNSNVGRELKIWMLKFGMVVNWFQKTLKLSQLQKKQSFVNYLCKREFIQHANNMNSKACCYYIELPYIVLLILLHIIFQANIDSLRDHNGSGQLTASTLTLIFLFSLISKVNMF